MDKLKLVRDPKILKAVYKLHTLCFDDDYFQILSTRPKEFGDIYALTLDRTLLGYAIYGQIWLPQSPYGYISSIGVHPHHQQKGWGLKILNAILTDLSTRPNCPEVYADIRQSNVASQQLFKKAGFYIHRESDQFYNDEIGIRVMKTLQPMEAQIWKDV